MDSKTKELEDKVTSAVSVLIARAEAWAHVRGENDRDGMSIQNDADALEYVSESLEMAVEYYKKAVEQLHRHTRQN